MGVVQGMGLNDSKTSIAQSKASLEAFLGDLEGLAERVGLNESRIEAATIGFGGLCLKDVTDDTSLSRFLTEYRDQFLLPFELPAVSAATNLVREGRFRELLDLDQSFAQRREMEIFGEQSRWIGQCHARSMRGMRDHRVVWRYCEAVRTGEAFGWHPVVYGVVLGAFSIPLRQGLANYTRQMLQGFIDSAVHRGVLEASIAAEIGGRLLSDLPAYVEGALGAPDQPLIRAL